MRCAHKRSTTATLVPLRLGPTQLCTVWLLASVGCNQRGELREWRADDHQPPPSETPAGQGAGEETGDPTARAAAALWSMRCARCHGEQGRGDGNDRPPGAQLPDFGAAAFQAGRTDAQLAEIISKGRNLMPAFGTELTKEGIEALVAHVRRLRAGAAQ